MAFLPKTSFAMVQTGIRELKGQDLPMPQIDANSAILKIEACGICGSDYEQFEGVLGTPMPAVPGHEPLGTIAAIGDLAAKRWGGRCRRQSSGGDDVILPYLLDLSRR